MARQSALSTGAWPTRCELSPTLRLHTTLLSTSNTVTHKVLAIGVDTDQFYSVFDGNTTAHPNLSYLLTSAQKSVDVAVDRMVRKFITGELSKAASLAQYTFDYSNDGVRLADWHLNTALTPNQRATIADVELKLSVGLLITGIEISNLLNLVPFSWSADAPFSKPPAPRYDAASCTVVDPYLATPVLLVFGGTTASGKSQSDLWEYTPSREQWLEHTTANNVAAPNGVPAARAGEASDAKRAGLRRRRRM